MFMEAETDWLLPGLCFWNLGWLISVHVTIRTQCSFIALIASLNISFSFSSSRMCICANDLVAVLAALQSSNHSNRASIKVVTSLQIYRGSLHTSQISHLLLYPSLRLLVPGLSSHFCHCFLYNQLLRSTLVSNIFGKWVQDSVSFGNPWI